MPPRGPAQSTTPPAATAATPHAAVATPTPTTAGQIGLDAETVVEALVNAHKVRPERYTILDSGLNRVAAARAAEATGVI